MLLYALNIYTCFALKPTSDNWVDAKPNYYKLNKPVSDWPTIKNFTMQHTHIWIVSHLRVYLSYI